MITSLSKKYLWYCYIVVLIICGIARMLERIQTDSGGLASRYAPVLIAVVVSVGIYGSANNKPVFVRWFWQCLYIVLGLAAVVATVMFAYLLLFVGLSTLPAATILLIVSIVLLPALIKLRIYVHKTPGCWQ